MSDATARSQVATSWQPAAVASPCTCAMTGGKAGWSCHTPMVAVARDVGRKRAMEIALTGDVIDAATALEWGLVNRGIAAFLDKRAPKWSD